MTAARLKDIDLKDTKRVLNLLAIQFEAQTFEFLLHGGELI